MIGISESAAKKLYQLKQDDGKDPSAFLRVQVKKGGCSGLSYKMDFDTELKTGDQIFESNGQKIAVDGDSILYILGMTLDFSGGLNGKGFVFNNPNATKNCGCGSSFNV
ncbi:MAG: HesB/IscA family protein [Pseudobdellovibrionaceae bacterium]|jgi:iron-sulfur cluster assembly protein